MNTELQKTEKTDFEKYFFKLINHAVFWKTIKNVRKHTNIKLVATEGRKNYLVSEPNNPLTKVISENFLATEMKNNKKIFMNKPVSLHLSILELGKIVMYEF